MKVSDWFPGDVKPVRDGWYFTSIGAFEGWSFWFGDYWGTMYLTSTCPAWSSKGKSEMQFKAWKGQLK